MHALIRYDRRSSRIVGGIVLGAGYLFTWLIGISFAWLIYGAGLIAGAEIGLNLESFACLVIREVI